MNYTQIIRNWFESSRLVQKLNSGIYKTPATCSISLMFNHLVGAMFDASDIYYGSIFTLLKYSSGDASTHFIPLKTCRVKLSLISHF